jgi:hypothetical protein
MSALHFQVCYPEAAMPKYLSSPHHHPFDHPPWLLKQEHKNVLNTIKVTVNMKIEGFWEVMQCFWLSSSQHFKGLSCLLPGLLSPKDKSPTVI